MKLLFDQNLSPRLPRLLADLFPDSLHVREAGLRDADDAAIWDYAKTHGFVIVSKDSDFQQRAMILGHPPKVIWIRLGNCPTADVASLLRSRQSDILTFEADPTASFLAVA